MDIEMCTKVAVETNEKGLSRVKALNGGVGAATPDTTDGQTKCSYATTMKRGKPADIEENARVVIETVENADLRCILGTNCWDVKGSSFVNRDALVYSARKYGQYKET
jgi:hypothetical protein